MLSIARLQRMNHGSQFRAFNLRGDQFAKPIDPFLAVDHAWISGPTFPPHPHAGFSAVSYLFLDSETGIDNRDALGNRNLIQPVYWQGPLALASPQALAEAVEGYRRGAFGKLQPR